MCLSFALPALLSAFPLHPCPSPSVLLKLEISRFPWRASSNLVGHISSITKRKHASIEASSPCSPPSRALFEFSSADGCRLHLGANQTPTPQQEARGAPYSEAAHTASRREALFFVELVWNGEHKYYTPTTPSLAIYAELAGSPGGSWECPNFP